MSVLGQSVLSKAAPLKAAAAHLYQVLNGQQRILNTNSQWTWPKAKPGGLPGMRGDCRSQRLPGVPFKMRLSAALWAFACIAVATKSDISSPLYLLSIYIQSMIKFTTSQIFMVHIIDCMDFTVPTAPCGIEAVWQNEQRLQTEKSPTGSNGHSLGRETRVSIGGVRGHV